MYITFMISCIYHIQLITVIKLTKWNIFSKENKLKYSYDHVDQLEGAV